MKNDPRPPCPKCGTILKCPVCDRALTPAEQRVLEQFCINGDQDPDLAAALGLARGTVKTHMSNVMKKLDVHTRTELALVAIRTGLVGKEVLDDVGSPAGRTVHRSSTRILPVRYPER